MSIEVKGGREHTSGGSGVITKTAKLNLVDLAGSERWDTSGADADRHMRRELTQINTSLSALGNCIARLTEDDHVHVPYRDSQVDFFFLSLFHCEERHLCCCCARSSLSPFPSLSVFTLSLSHSLTLSLFSSSFFSPFPVHISNIADTTFGRFSRW